MEKIKTDKRPPDFKGDGVAIGQNIGATGTLKTNFWIYVLLCAILAVLMAFGYILSDIYDKLPADTQTKKLVSVTLDKFNTIEEIPQGANIICDDGIEISTFDCYGCSYWVEGRGTCVYKVN